jgi:hypothetical protein
MNGWTQWHLTYLCDILLTLRLHKLPILTHTWHNWQTAGYASFVHQQNDQHDEASIYKPHLLLQSILAATDN